MLLYLEIENYGLIDSLSLEFEKGFHVITGETGAGKSLMLGALSLVLGARADQKMMLRSEKKCIVEATFKSNQDLKPFFEENELSFEAEIILRREIQPGGKSRAFVNDTPVNLSILNYLGTRLVNVHSQHETLSLSDASFQLNVLDIIGETKKELQAYKEIYLHHKLLVSQLKDIEEGNGKNDDIDYLIYQRDEISQNIPRPGEIEELEREQLSLEHAEEIGNILKEVVELLNGENNMLQVLSQLSGRLKKMGKFYPPLSSFGERLHSAHIELEDFVGETEKIAGDLIYDPKKLEEIKSRLNSLNRLLKKHQCLNENDLIVLEKQLTEKIDKIASKQKDIEILKTEIETKRTLLKDVAHQLHMKRVKAIEGLESGLKTLLNQVSMPDGRIEVECIFSEEIPYSADGMSRVNFKFSSNQGVAAEDLGKVASGGELSRLMLCLKSIVAGRLQLPTLLFDEIDTGISGEVGSKVGKMMSQLSKNHQLIAITHLPQLAAQAETHIYVYKEIKEGMTYTRVRKLSKEQRIEEIAKMLSGEKVSAASIESAKELMAQ